MATLFDFFFHKTQQKTKKIITNYLPRANVVTNNIFYLLRFCWYLQFPHWLRKLKWELNFIPELAGQLLATLDLFEFFFYKSQQKTKKIMTVCLSNKKKYSPKENVGTNNIFTFYYFFGIFNFHNSFVS